MGKLAQGRQGPGHSSDKVGAGFAWFTDILPIRGNAGNLSERAYRFQQRADLPSTIIPA